MAPSFAISRHKMACEPEMVARLEGPAGHCPLSVSGDYLVGGSCWVPVGSVETFTLTYYLKLEDGGELLLAQASRQLNLRAPEQDSVTLRFAYEDLNIDGLDDDADGVSNLDEVCAGTDPFVAP